MLQSHVIEIDGAFVGAAVRLDTGYRFIATDFRLGIQTPALDSANSGELDARKAAQTLLELYAHLQAEQQRDEDVRTRVRFRVKE